MDFTNFIQVELLVLIPVLMLIGFAIKKTKISNENIPLLLGAVGIVLSALWVLGNNFSAMADAQDWINAVFTAVVQGVLVAGASVYSHQIYKQKLS